ncbi:MAG TPA: BPL-N domain-containing protein [Ktedonobacteraceae bacterium]|nr:BPL-N domain-containing protein [Ktedonobacteraceae bacterium]
MSKSMPDLHKNRPLALVYRGPAGCPGCSEAVVTLLQNSQWRFEVHYVGPHERLHLSAATLKMATLYAQPGGNGTVKEAFALLQANASSIRKFVKAGGRYLGSCMGAYLAGSDPGFHLLPGDTDQFIASPRASVTSEEDTIVQVTWRDQTRFLYFQDGPYFILHRGTKNVTVLATYTNGKIAALVAPYGKGKVGVVGPHPEATAAWYEAYQLVDPDGPDADLGYDLLDTLMQS